MVVTTSRVIGAVTSFANVAGFTSYQCAMVDFHDAGTVALMSFASGAATSVPIMPLALLNQVGTAFVNSDGSFAIQLVTSLSLLPMPWTMPWMMFSPTGTMTLDGDFICQAAWNARIVAAWCALTALLVLLFEVELLNAVLSPVTMPAPMYWPSSL